MIELKELKQISFSIASTEDILNKSVYEVNLTKFSESKTNTVYDHRGGSVFNKRCETCRQFEQQCPGHFGVLKLNYPVVHPLFFTFVHTMLKIVCHVCSKLLISKEHLIFSGINKFDGERKISEIVKKVKKLNKCFHCQSEKRNYTIKKDPMYNIILYNDTIELSDIKIKSILSEIDEETVQFLGISHPKNYVLDVFPVIPPCCRPYEFAGIVMKEDDLTKQIVEIVKANLNVKQTDSASIHNLKLKIEMFCRNPKKKLNIISEPIKGIRERLTGKDGQLRTNLMGKRTEMSARTVIGPGPNLKLDEVGVPESIAKAVSFPVEVFQHNMLEVKNMISSGLVEKIKRNGQIIRIDLQIYSDIMNFLCSGDIIIRQGKKIAVKDTKIKLFSCDKIYRDGIDITPSTIPKIKDPDIKIGDIAQRRILNGDCVLLNRQPTLWKGSMMAFKTVISKSFKTFTFNLAVCKAFNSDFDGDEQNAHFPQSLSSVTELKNLSTPQECLLSSSNGTPIIVILQDALLGSYLMTVEDNNFRVNKRQYFDIISTLSLDVNVYLERYKTIKEHFDESYIYSGKGLISLILPYGFNYSDSEILIENGILKRGTLTKTYLGSTKKSIIYRLKMEFGNNETVNFINDIQFMTNKWLTFHSFSINISDFKSEKIDLKKSIDDADYISNTILNKSLAEAKINVILSNAKDVGIRLASESRDNNMVKTINAGSKGDFFNLGQVKGMLGQQLINGRRIQKCLNNCTRTLIHYPDEKYMNSQDKYQSRGFISKGFYEGIDPKEFIFHAMSGRQGVCDTAMTTHSAGYSMRKLIKLKEDIKIGMDGTVTDSANNIYSYAFGDDGFDPSMKHKLFDRIFS